MDIKKEFYSKLLDDKIKINWNKNPIKMTDFLSFLTIQTTRSRNHLGSCNGWTLLENKEESLYISGGVINGVEHLDSLKFGKNLSNPYNNYVNPFYLWNILNLAGREFFISYYKNEFDEIRNKSLNKLNALKQKVKQAESIYTNIEREVYNLRSKCKSSAF